MMQLPTCLVHKRTHPPILCRTERVWHPTVCVPKPVIRDEIVTGTHGGFMGERTTRHLDDEARERRRIKNARRLSRRSH